MSERTIDTASAPTTTRKQLLLLAEGTLALVTVAAVLGLRRVFADGSFLPHVLFSALLAHILAAQCRRRRLGPAPSMAIGAVAAVLVVTWMQLASSTTLGLPTPGTLTLARSQLDDAWRTFGQVVAPAPVLPGFVLVASLGAWLVAFAADTAAFRARAGIESIVPAATLFVFGGALGTGTHRLDVAALFIGAVLVHWLAQRSLSATSATTWLASAAGGGTRSLLRLGAVLAAVGVVAAVAIGPRLPGADARGVVPWRATDRSSPDSRVTISPLVDIRSRLVDQSNVELFRVRASAKSYWRLTSLERFDGRIWSSNRQYRPATGGLSADVRTAPKGATTVQQHFTIEALSSIWLPAAFRPVKVGGVKARYDGDSNSLLTEADTAAGLTYTVTSSQSALTAAELEGVHPVAPSSVANEYTTLPDGFSPAVQQEAARIVVGTRTQYEKAMALQAYFRSGAFIYDLTVPAGHSGDHLEIFLFRTKRGYCEQFSGAYAAMARAVGLPARVAVGFTPGEYDAPTGSYLVKGFNSHAWPEVYLDGFGWAAFEPTPGRGMPGAQSYTGVPEAQAQAGNPGAATTVPTTTPVRTGGGGPAPTAAPSTPSTVAEATAKHTSPWPRRLLVALWFVTVVPILWAAVLAGLRSLRRRRRRSAATTPGARVLVAWDEVSEALARAGSVSQPWETPNEYAVRAAGATGVDSRLLAGLAGLTTLATYGPGGVAPTAAEQATEVAGTIEKEAGALVGRRDRLRFLVDPRPLLPDKGARVDVRESAAATARRA